MFPYSKIKLICETSPNVPPPYAHRYDLFVDENPSHLVLSFDLKYLEREDLTEEEILDEGFTTNDDFSWMGKLNQVWKKEFESLLQKTRFAPAAEEGDYIIYIESEHKDKPGQGYVTKKYISDWVYLIQEIKQAIYESEQIEAPLTIEYLHLEEGKETQIVLNGRFAEREFTVRVNNRPVEKWDWQVLQKTINLIYNDTEIDTEKMLKGRPRYEGYYLQLPGLGWYGLGKGIRSRYKGDTVIADIIRAMEEFTGRK